MTKTSIYNLILVLPLFLLSACSEGGRPQGLVSADEAPAGVGIVGGSAVDNQSWIRQSTVALGKKTKGTFKSFCTGVIIGPDLVLTAAHCMEEAGKKLTLYFGNTYTPYDKSLEKSTTQWIVNDRYRPIYEEDLGLVVSASGDLAMIKVPGGIPKSSKAVKIGTDHKLAKDTEVTIAGWGLTNEKEETISDRLYTTKIPFADYWKTHLVFDQTNGIGACRGDSGGPAYLVRENQEVLVLGTVRGGHAFSGCNGMIEYTNLSAHQKFLNAAAMKLSGKKLQYISLQGKL